MDALTDQPFDRL